MGRFWSEENWEAGKSLRQGYQQTPLRHPCSEPHLHPLALWNTAGLGTLKLHML